MYWKKIRSLVAGMAIVALVAGTVWAATYSDFVSGNRWVSQSAYEPVGAVPVYQKRLIDLSDANFNSGSGVTDGDVVQCLTIPAQTIITEIGIYAVRGVSASSSGVSAVLGDGADPNGYCTELDFTAGGSTVWYTRGNFTVLAAAKSGAYNNTSGVSIYEAGDTIDLTFQQSKGKSTSGATPSFIIWAKGFKKPTQ